MENVNALKPRKIETKQMVVMAMLAAISIAFVTAIHFPLFPAAGFLEYDPADIPILIGTFIYGPMAGFILTVIVSIIQGSTVSAGSGIIGIVMHIVATGSCVLIAGNIYWRTKTRTSAIAALFIGALTMTVAMVLLNLVLTPLFLGAPLEVVLQMLIPIIIPFNLLKSGINCFITFLLYKSIAHIIDSFHAKG